MCRHSAGRGRHVAAVIVGAVLLLAACTTTPDGGDRPADPGGADAWVGVTPPDVEPTALTTAGDLVLVGGASVNHEPRLAVRRTDSWQPVQVTPVSGYGPAATLVHLAGDPDGRVVAIGTATGGAHLNPRWTAWVGSIDDGLIEEPQSPETFGGPDAGGITGVTTGAAPLVIGTWSLSAAGLGVATWKHAGTRWQREPVSKALSGTGDAQTTATAAATTRSSTVIVGLETSLPGGSVRQQGVAWVRPRDGTRWTRIDLDTTDIDSAATDVACAPNDCVIVGRMGDTLGVWRLVGTEVTRLTGVPGRTIDSYAGQPEVAVDGSAGAVAIADGSSTVLVADDAQASWRVIDTPPGELRGLAVTGSELTLLLRTADGRQAVYSRGR